MNCLSIARPRLKLDGLVVAAARVGYASRGFVYLSMGVLAVMAALDLRGAAPGSLAALALIVAAPLGEWWLILVGAGLGAFAFWRAMQAFLDADRQGLSPKALAKRAGQGLSALIYATLSVSGLELTDELEDIGEADEEQRADRQAAFLLDLPFGDWLLMALGLFVIGVGVGNMLHAFNPRFSSDLDCSKMLRAVAKPIGRAGYLARGVAFMALGFTLARAGFDARASEATGLGGALQSLEAMPGGEMPMMIVAAGLALFGLFGLMEARYRQLRAPTMVERVGG